jgi:tRNA A-37 threonylcarbamoyl transferase component Bud32
MNAEESGASTEWRAKELKRRIQNRRNIPDSNVALDTKLLSITLLPQLLEVKHENHNIQMHYLECEAKNRNSMHYYDQHFKMEKNIR